MKHSVKNETSYMPLFGSILYRDNEGELLRLMDYADEWDLASAEEKRMIKICAAGPALLKALKALLPVGDNESIAEAYMDEILAAENAINEAEGQV
jgi:hypothetical protein